MRPSTLVFHVTQRLLYTKWRDPGEEPKLHLFGQLKRITSSGSTCLVCKGGTYPAQLMYQELADMACNRITAGIASAFIGKRPIKALLDPYNPAGSTRHVNFNTSRDRWETERRRCHVNWVILDSDWEAEFCRVAESHPRVRAYVKNHNLGFEVPYRYGSETRKYLPDFIVLVDDGHGADDLLHLVVEIKGYRREDAKEKKSTMDTYWVPGVNHLGTLRPLGIRRVHRRLSDRGRLQGQGRKRVQQDDRVRRRAAGGARKLDHGQESQQRRRPSRPSRTTRPSGRTSRRPSTSPSLQKEQQQPDPRRATTAATATSTRSSSGAARTSRTGATSSSTRRRSTSRRRSTRRC